MGVADNHLHSAIMDALFLSTGVVVSRIFQPLRIASLQTGLLQWRAFHSAALRSFQASLIEDERAWLAGEGILRELLSGALKILILERR